MWICWLSLTTSSQTISSHVKERGKNKYQKLETAGTICTFKLVKKCVTFWKIKAFCHKNIFFKVLELKIYNFAQNPVVKILDICFFVILVKIVAAKSFFKIF